MKGRSGGFIGQANSHTDFCTDCRSGLDSVVAPVSVARLLAASPACVAPRRQSVLVARSAGCRSCVAGRSLVAVPMSFSAYHR